MIDTKKKYTCINHQVEFIGENRLVVCGKIRGSEEDLFFVWDKDTGAPYHANESFLEEVKEPACEPWTAADVPWPWPVWIRNTNGTPGKSLITCISSSCVFCGPDRIAYESLYHFEYTTDGKTWLPCRKGTREQIA